MELSAAMKIEDKMEMRMIRSRDKIKGKIKKMNIGDIAHFATVPFYWFVHKVDSKPCQ